MRIYVQPTGCPVPYPGANMKKLTGPGYVEPSVWWRRRIADGSVVLVEPPAPEPTQAPAPKARRKVEDK